ncbi:MAG TPA: class I SAM-dependent methyltransferase [Acidimicrobiales bacterium]|nr:class I SAM-dependent methyltransferase [Acidimicrobiales bacterium]
MWAASHAHLVVELAERDRVLEVGTGTGMLSALLGRLSGFVVTVDSDLDVLRVASTFATRVGAPVRQTAGDAFSLPYRRDSFDAVFSQGLYEHFGDQAIVGLAEEHLRVAPRVYISVPTFFYPHLGHRGPGLIGNERLMTRRHWSQVLRRFSPKLAYYADYKLVTLAGWTCPWPNQLLITLER